jgi:hypothetical protein
MLIFCLFSYVSLVPTSAITGEGVPDILMLMIQLMQVGSIFMRTTLLCSTHTHTHSHFTRTHINYLENACRQVDKEFGSELHDFGGESDRRIWHNDRRDSRRRRVARRRYDCRMRHAERYRYQYSRAAHAASRQRVARQRSICSSQKGMHRLPLFTFVFFCFLSYVCCCRFVVQWVSRLPLTSLMAPLLALNC